jgi:hypothetical protein
MSARMFASALIGLLLVFGGGSAVTIATTTSAQARNMADCDGLRGDDKLECQAQRAEGEARSQRRGEGGRRRGCGQKCRDCMAHAEALRERKGGYEIDSATNYVRDCLD